MSPRWFQNGCCQLTYSNSATVPAGSASPPVHRPSKDRTAHFADTPPGHSLPMVTFRIPSVENFLRPPSRRHNQCLQRRATERRFEKLILDSNRPAGSDNRTTTLRRSNRTLG